MAWDCMVYLLPLPHHDVVSLCRSLTTELVSLKYYFELGWKTRGVLDVYCWKEHTHRIDNKITETEKKCQPTITVQSAIS